MNNKQIMCNKQDAELIAADTCPVCKKARVGHVNRRRALQEHIRRAKDPAHTIWFMQHYKTHFIHGGERRELLPPTEQDILAAIEIGFGIEWAQRVHFEVPAT